MDVTTVDDALEAVDRAEEMLEALVDDVEDENGGLVETLEEEKEDVLMYRGED